MSDRLKAYSTIRTLSERHPEVALQAVMDGQRDATDKLKSRLAETDAALLSALCLVKTKRLDSDLSKSLTQTIVKAIDHQNASPIEKSFIKDAKETGE